ncbi:MAG: esterase family protein [Pirellulales bacterium]|nr:esterase family protein [Pirellulales bacterium]
MLPRLWNRLTTLGLAAMAVALSAAPALAEAPRPRFVVKLPVERNFAPCDARVFVFCSQRAGHEPRLGPNWFAPEPFFAGDVKQLEPGREITIDDAADGFPDVLSRLPAGRYFVQALVDRDLDHHHPGRAPGNWYSRVAEIEFNPRADLVAALDVVEEVPLEEPFPETDVVKELVLESGLLSDFHRRPVRQRGAVVLPISYAQQPERRYPVLYIIPGFGGSYRSALAYQAGAPAAGPQETEFIRVVVEGECKWGHHTFADSATNGPRGTSFVREYVPLVDRTYRTIAAPTARFLTGHSSGGWASLWLQVSYPDDFAGVWSTSPDPVDFRDFQQVDLYQEPPLSLYVDEQGNRRPIARRGDQPVLWFDSFGLMDDVIGRGGQLRSFEAVFSPRGPDGQPARAWDRRTGRIDPDVVRAWRSYDIRLKLEENWAILGPKLAGKLHIWTGELDTFYLTGAVEKLASSLAALGSDAQVTILPGRNHANVLSPELCAEMRRGMTAALVRQHADVAVTRADDAGQSSRSRLP